MKVERRDILVTKIDIVDYGTVFEYGGKVFIKTNVKESSFGVTDYKCCNLFDGSIEYFSSEACVTILKAKVVIE